MLFSQAYVNAQTMRDVVELKNGSVIKGIIVEQTPPEKIKLQTADGSIFVFRYDEILKMSREEVAKTVAEKPVPKLEEYAGKAGIGIALGGGGIAGIPIRVYPSRKFALELGVFVRPSVVQTRYTTYTTINNGNGQSYTYATGDRTETDLRFPPMIAGGFDFFLGESYKPWKDKIYRNGILFRFGKTVGAEFAGEKMIVLGWAKERFKARNKNASYLFELGAGVIKYDISIDSYGFGPSSDIFPLIYWKLHWNFLIIK